MHRVVDDRHEIITGTKVTAGSIHDCDVLEEMIELHQKNTQGHVDTVVADSKYGTIDNFFHCHDLGVKAHIPSFTCSAGQTLIKKKYKKNRKHC